MNSGMVRWEEPWPSLDKDGNQVVANIELQASVRDAINIARRVANILGGKGASDEELLQEFMAIHYAWVDNSGIV